MNEPEKENDRSKTRYYSSGVGEGNQYAQLVDVIAPAVAFVRRSLLAGEKVSDVAFGLHRQGFGGLMTFICVFREATDAGIGELKGFGRWWSDGSGPTECEAFDAYAMELGLHRRVTG